MSNYTIHENGATRAMTEAEKTQWDADASAYNADKVNRKLALIKKLRLRKLQETDYLSNSDVVMPDNIKTWRQNLRNLPQDNSTEEEYDLLLARDSDGNLTNAIWSKP